MQKRSSECQTADKPPPYERKKDELIIAQNQVKLVHYPDRELIDQIDTEPHLTIRQIRDFLYGNDSMSIEFNLLFETAF